jgi:hypothetical protein
MTMTPQEILEISEEVLDWKSPTLSNGNGRNGGVRQNIIGDSEVQHPRDYYERVLVEQGFPEAWNVAATNARILQRKLETCNSQLAQLRKSALDLLKATAERGSQLEQRKFCRTRRMRKEQNARRALQEAMKGIPAFSWMAKLTDLTPESSTES